MKAPGETLNGLLQVLSNIAMYLFPTTSWENDAQRKLSPNSHFHFPRHWFDCMQRPVFTASVCAKKFLGGWVVDCPSRRPPPYQSAYLRATSRRRHEAAGAPGWVRRKYGTGGRSIRLDAPQTPNRASLAPSPRRVCERRPECCLPLGGRGCAFFSAIPCRKGEKCAPRLTNSGVNRDCGVCLTRQ